MPNFVVTSSRRHRRWLVQTVQTAGIMVMLIITLLLAPAIAQVQNPEPSAAVVVDGQQLFQVSSSGNYSATERADLINLRLQTAVESPDPPTVAIQSRDKLPTILLNDRHLLTVTTEDVIQGSTQQEQARLWAQQITTALEQAQEERTLAYLRQAILQAVGMALLALLLHLGLGRFWRRTLRPTLLSATEPEHDADGPEQSPTTLNMFLSLLLTVARAGVWLAASLFITNLFPLTRQWAYRAISSLVQGFTAPILTLGQSAYSVTDLLILVGMLFGLVMVTKILTNLVKSRILEVTGVNRGAQEAVTIIIRYSLIFIGTIVLLQVWGLDISSLAILASALGVGIGFGLQDIAKNFGSGLVLVFERPIQVGDFVEVGSFQGTVERMGARSTLIRTLDQVSIIVPNSRFLEEEVINWSHDNPISRIHVPVGVAYGSDINLVKSALLESTRGHARVLSTPPPQVFFKGFGDSSLDFELLIWTAEPNKQLLIRSDLYFKIEALLRQHGVEIPFPQRDLHVRSGNLPVELSPQLEQTLQRLIERSINGHTS